MVLEVITFYFHNNSFFFLISLNIIVHTQKLLFLYVFIPIKQATGNSSPALLRLPCCSQLESVALKTVELIELLSCGRHEEL